MYLLQPSSSCKNLLGGCVYLSSLPSVQQFSFSSLPAYIVTPQLPGEHLSWRLLPIHESICDLSTCSHLCFKNTGVLVSACSVLSAKYSWAGLSTSLQTESLPLFCQNVCGQWGLWVDYCDFFCSPNTNGLLGFGKVHLNCCQILRY